MDSANSCLISGNTISEEFVALYLSSELNNH